IFGPKPNKPTKPPIPVASYEESVYKGTISRLDTAETASFYIPGTLPHGYGATSVDVPPFKYPAYNEVLGLVALLKTPSAEIHMSYETDMPFYLVSGGDPNDACIWE